MDSGLVYVGKIIDLQPIEGADFIEAATVIAGKGGKWRGVVKKDDFNLDDLCTVYLPDAVVQPCEEMKFLESSNWRVRMRRFKGCPSEVVILPCEVIYKEMKFLESSDRPVRMRRFKGCPSEEVILPCEVPCEGRKFSEVVIFPGEVKGRHHVGDDITEFCNVKKYVKEIPASLVGKAKGDLPSFVRKTDEPNWQRSSDLIDLLRGQPYYVMEKMDGSSTSAYKWKGEFGVCSRNLDLIEDPKNGYWEIANQYNLRDKLPEGYALQWETCGPKIQSNPMGLSKIQGFAFGVWDIANHQYLSRWDFFRFCETIGFPMVKILGIYDSYAYPDLTELAKGKYDNGAEREGVVVRSCHHIGGRIISFKALNLDYKH